VRRAGIDWLSSKEAICAIIAARDARVALLGFDAARLGGQMTQPSMVDSRDYSSPTYPSVPDPYADAIQFISERAESGLHFEIVLGKENSN